MPLDIESNQKELNLLASALDQISSRQTGEIPKKHFACEAERIRETSRILDHLHHLETTGIRILLGHLKTSIKLLETLPSHTSSKEGQAFWKNKLQILLGLSDVLQSKINKKALTPAL